MFCVVASGDILKVRTDTNPCRIVDTWPCQDPEKGESIISLDGVNFYLIGVITFVILKTLSKTYNEKVFLCK